MHLHLSKLRRGQEWIEHEGNKRMHVATLSTANAAMAHTSCDTLSMSDGIGLLRLK